MTDSDSITIRPSETGASGEISRTGSVDSIVSSLVNIDAVVSLPAEAAAEGLELDLRVVKRGTPQSQFNPEDIPIVSTEEQDAGLEDRFRSVFGEKSDWNFQNTLALSQEQTERKALDSESDLSSAKVQD